MGVRYMAHPLPPPAQPPPQVGPCPSPGRSMPSSSHLPSWQLLPAQLLVVPACECKRQKEVRLLSCGCQLQLRLPGGFVCRRRGRRRRSCGPKRRHLLPLLFLGCLGCLGCPLASLATTPLAFRRRLDVVSTGFSAARSIWTSRSRNYRHGSPGEARRRSARGVALRDAHDRLLAREGGQGIWLQARGAVWPLGGR